MERTIIGKDGYIRGATVRTAAIGKSPVYFNRSIQKPFPLESCIKDKMKDESGKENNFDKEPKIGDERSCDEEVNGEKRMRRVPAREAVKDAAWRTRLMLNFG